MIDIEILIWRLDVIMIRLSNRPTHQEISILRNHEKECVIELYKHFDNEIDFVEYCKRFNINWRYILD